LSGLGLDLTLIITQKRREIEIPFWFPMPALQTDTNWVLACFACYVDIRSETGKTQFTKLSKTDSSLAGLSAVNREPMLEPDTVIVISYKKSYPGSDGHQP
jgi:hypothetical protein